MTGKNSDDEKNKMELKIEHLHLAFFGHEECLHDVNLCFGEGVWALYGDKGSGKTAILKCIARINEYSGDILLDGDPLDTGKTGDVKMVFDDLALFKRRSLYYNLTYPLRLRKVPKNQWEATLAPVLKEWGLTKTFLDNPVYRASEDVKVRVAMARAGLVQKKVLLLDNPLRQLSIDERRQMFWTLSRFIREYPGIVVYATDSIEEVKSLHCQVALLSGGYVMGVGTPSALAEKMPNVFIAARMKPYWRAVEGTADHGKIKTDLGDFDAEYPPTYEGKCVLAGIAPNDWVTCEGSDYTVCNVLWAEGEPYSVLEKDDAQIVVCGEMEQGMKTSVMIGNRLPVFDPTSEWRIDKAEGEIK